ncbi:MAG: L-histidine N(alpha)-methyltransferase [Alphaproteobacteria bacterium]|nr:L-histidine N(alpha)-methyltransferase [Alphaproteobacteria bacterium]
MKVTTSNVQAPNGTGLTDPLLVSLVDLFEHVHWGNMGPELYRNGGSKKFERILTSTYTPYSGETKLISDNLPMISSWAQDTETAIIVGPGPAMSVMAKEIPVLQSLPNLKKVIVIELSPEFNKESTAAIQTVLPNVKMSSYLEDFRTVDLSAESYSSALVISTGGLTNFENISTDHFPHAQVTSHLQAIKRLAKSGGKFMWGYDSSTDADRYNRKEISEFLLYPLEKASKRSGVIIDPTGFEHITYANTAASVLSHDWVVTRDQDIQIGNQHYALSAGEKFVAFSSAKLTPDKTARSAAFQGINTNVYYSDGDGVVIHTFDCV